MQRYEKLYIVTRRDLPPGLQAAQVAHAAFLFAYEHHPIHRQWLTESNFLIILSVENEEALSDLGERAEALNLPVSWFTEPDIDDQLTAIAIAPSPTTVELCADLPLALREFNESDEKAIITIQTDDVMRVYKAVPLLD